MHFDRLIIDGYNLLHQTDELAGLLQTDIQSARHRLVRMVEETAHRLAGHTTIVFDGRTTGSDDALGSRYLEVIFSPANLSADTVIERLVCRCATAENILVVTSDRAECDTVSSAGAHTMSSQEFMGRCRRTVNRSADRRKPPGKEPTLGDHFPDELR
jgi:predicted RNA-binding protein with PIN domain